LYVILSKEKKVELRTKFIPIKNSSREILVKFLMRSHLDALFN